MEAARKTHPGWCNEPYPGEIGWDARCAREKGHDGQHAVSQEGLLWGPRPTYTDEGGRERCPIGGCVLTVESSDEGTCSYRVVPAGEGEG